MNATERALLLCISADRDDLSEPWTDGEWAWATDGWMLLRVPAADAPTIGRSAGDAHNPPPAVEWAHALLAAEPEEWVGVSRLPKQEMLKCRECVGAGVVRWASGYRKHRYEATCKTCAGAGEVPSDGERTVNVGGWTLRVDLARRIKSLAGVIGKRRDYQDPQSPAVWKCDHGRGLVMPVLEEAT